VRGDVPSVYGAKSAPVVKWRALARRPAEKISCQAPLLGMTDPVEKKCSAISRSLFILPPLFREVKNRLHRQLKYSEEQPHFQNAPI